MKRGKGVKKLEEGEKKGLKGKKKGSKKGLKIWIK